MAVQQNELASRRADAARVAALLERASLALASGDVAQTAKLLNTAWQYSAGTRDYLIRLEREQEQHGVIGSG